MFSGHEQRPGYSPFQTHGYAHGHTPEFSAWPQPWMNTHAATIPWLMNMMSNLAGQWQWQWQSPWSWQWLHQMQTQPQPFRVRETDAYIFCDILVPQLTMGDLEVEVSGNRIVCRTRVPVQGARWGQGYWQAWSQAPRGLEVFELPEGRFEFSWLCPVNFAAKDVEATFRDGYLSICVPKADTTTTRHSVKITKEPTARRSEMNS